MATDQKHSGINFQRLKRSIKQPCVKLHQLGNKSHVRVDAFSSLFYFIVSLLIRNFLAEDLVSNHDRRRSADTLNAVHIDFSVLLSSLLNKLYSIIENARNVLTNMIFQMIRLVLNAILLKVILRIVSCTVDNMSDAQTWEDLFVFCNKVTAQPHEVVDYIRANALVILVFILFARCAFEVEIFVVQLVGCDLKRFEVSRSWVALTLNSVVWVGISVS